MTWKKCLKIIGVIIICFIIGIVGMICYIVNGAHNSPDVLNAELVVAASEGNVSSVNNLLQKGVNVNYSNGDTTPLMSVISAYSVYKNPEMLEVIKLLISKGANVNMQNKKGETALFRTYNNKEVIDLLIANGADVNIKDNKGQTYKIAYANSMKQKQEELKKSSKEAVAKVKEEPQSKPDLELIEEHSEDGYVCGTIVNNTNKEYRYVQVNIGLYDSDKNKVGSTFTNVTNLEAKGKWKFRAPVLYDNVKKFTIDGVDGY